METEEEICPVTIALLTQAPPRKQHPGYYEISTERIEHRECRWPNSCLIQTVIPDTNEQPFTIHNDPVLQDLLPHCRNPTILPEEQA